MISTRGKHHCTTVLATMNSSATGAAPHRTVLLYNPLVHCAAVQAAYVLHHCTHHATLQYRSSPAEQQRLLLYYCTAQPCCRSADLALHCIDVHCTARGRSVLLYSSLGHCSAHLALHCTPVRATPALHYCTSSAHHDRSATLALHYVASLGSGHTDL